MKDPSNRMLIETNTPKGKSLLKLLLASSLKYIYVSTLTVVCPCNSFTLILNVLPLEWIINFIHFIHSFVESYCLSHHPFSLPHHILPSSSLTPCSFVSISVQDVFTCPFCMFVLHTLTHSLSLSLLTLTSSASSSPSSSLSSSLRAFPLTHIRIPLMSVLGSIDRLNNSQVEYSVLSIPRHTRIYTTCFTAQLHLTCVSVLFSSLSVSFPWKMYELQYHLAHIFFPSFLSPCQAFAKMQLQLCLLYVFAVPFSPHSLSLFLFLWCVRGWRWKEHSMPEEQSVEPLTRRGCASQGQSMTLDFGAASLLHTQWEHPSSFSCPLLSLPFAVSFILLPCVVCVFFHPSKHLFVSLPLLFNQRHMWTSVCHSLEFPQRRAAASDSLVTWITRSCAI